MFGLIQNNRIIRKITVGFGSLFSNLVMVRYNYSTNPPIEQQRSVVALVEGQKETFIQALEGDPLQDNKIRMKLPIIAYSLKSMEYDASRKQQTTIQNLASTPSGIMSQYMPVPWNLHFEVVLFVRNIEDGTQIIEQILPFFTPDYTLILNLIPSMGIQNAISFTLDNVEYTVINDNAAKTIETRTVMWTLNFTAKALIYGPISSSSIIREAIVNIYNWKDVDGSNLYLVLNPTTGNGNYQQSEIVFQGKTLTTANATALVADWSNVTNRLLVTDVEGMFYNNLPLTGSTTGTSYDIINYEITPQILETIDVKPNPLTANATDDYTYTITKTYYNTAK